MIREIYAPNHQQRREQALQETLNTCSRCHKALFVMRLSRSRNLKFEQAHLHHPDGNPEDPDARVEILCDSCHMAAHRRPAPGQTKAAPRKKGYEVVRVRVFLDQLRPSGLETWDTENNQIAWQIGSLSGQAETPLDALIQAIHWMDGEIRDLESKSQQLTERSGSGGVR